MRAEGYQQGREGDLEAALNAVARGFSDNIRALSEILESKRAQGGGLSPEQQADLDALQKKIVNSHV